MPLRHPLTSAQRAAINASNRRSRQRKAGANIPYQYKDRYGNPIEYTPKQRCPVCGCAISAVQDCRCP